MEKNKILYYRELDSTNTKIQEMAATGAAHGTVVTCERQTAGKGRRGRTWESPAGENIYFSILLRPQIDPAKAPMLTLVMAQSVAKAIQRLGFEAVRIKWPNDLVLNGKKVCGILTEMQMNGTDIDSVVIGVGVNVNTEQFPKGLEETATSLYLQGNAKIERNKLLLDIVDIFEKEYEQFMGQGDLSFLREDYNRILVNKDREVRVLEPGNEYTAYALGVNDNGELMVRRDDGTVETVFSGEVSVRGVYGYV